MNMGMVVEMTCRGAGPGVNIELIPVKQLLVILPSGKRREVVTSGNENKFLLRIFF